MAEYIIQGSTLQDFADAIREMSGETEAIVVANYSDEIRTTLAELTEVVAEQDTLISELEAALEGKAMENDEDITEEVNTYTTLLTDLEATINSFPNASGGGDIKVKTNTFLLLSGESITIPCENAKYALVGLQGEFTMVAYGEEYADSGLLRLDDNG